MMFLLAENAQECKFVTFSLQAKPRVVKTGRLLRGLLENTLFEFLLAFDAVARPGNCLQPLGVDVLAAGDAFAETAFAYARQSAFDHLQQLAVVIALVKQELFVVGTGGAVGNILRRVFICSAHPAGSGLPCGAGPAA